MAIAIAEVAINMTTTNLATFWNPANNSLAPSNIVLEAQDGEILGLQGSYTFDGNGSLTGGTINSIVDSLGNQVLFGISQLNFPVEQFVNYLINNDNAAIIDALFAGADSIIGSSGADWLETGSGNDAVVAGAGNDTITTGQGTHLIYGNTGDDAIVISATSIGNDILYGGQGNDTISVGNGNNSIYGNLQDDLMWGGSGNDALYGGQGNDNMASGDGNDTLFGNKGDDTLSGGAGVNVFVFSPDGGNDTITDFSASDTIQLRGATQVVSIAASGADAIVTLTSGSIFLIGAAHLDIQSDIFHS